MKPLAFLTNLLNDVTSIDVAGFCKFVVPVTKMLHSMNGWTREQKI